MTMIDISHDVVLCPKNDQESLQIVQLCESFGIRTVISNQPHGATLAREDDLIDRLVNANPNASTVVIIEIPGPIEEDLLRQTGYVVKVIDHHAYGALDRTRQESSLEQFIEFFCITDQDLSSHGFEPLLVKGIGCIDRGFLWELPRAGFSPQEAERVRTYYEKLGQSLARKNVPTDEQLQEIWDSREEKDGVIIVRQGGVTPFGIREGISFILAKHYPLAEPPIIIIESDKIVAQGITCGEKLLAAFGGFLFGSEKCWGIQGSPADLPNIADILLIMR